jgi:hypothetical protein
MCCSTMWWVPPTPAPEVSTMIQIITYHECCHQVEPSMVVVLMVGGDVGGGLHVSSRHGDTVTYSSAGTSLHTDAAEATHRGV